jgi:hypothetical protein
VELSPNYGISILFSRGEYDTSCYKNNFVLY